MAHAGNTMDVQAEAVEFCEFDNSYARLPERFFTRLRPTPVAAPRLVRLNTKLALDLGLDPERLATPEGVEMLAGNLVPKVASRSLWLMPATNSGLSSLNSEMDAPFFLARSSTAPVCAATSSSRGPARRPIPGAATDVRDAAPPDRGRARSDRRSTPVPRRCARLPLLSARVGA